MPDKLTRAKIRSENTANIKRMYENHQENELVLRTYDLIRAALAEGFNLGEQSIRLLDCGIKPTELSTAIALALEKYPTEKLNDIDKKVQIACKELQVKVEVATEK